MSDTSNKIWVVSRAYPPDTGGVQTYAREISAAYAGLRWHVTTFMKSSVGPRRERDANVDLVDVGPGGKLRTYVRLFTAMLRALMRGERPCLVHACTWRSALPALLLGIPILITVHGREIRRPKGIAAALMWLALAYAHRIVAVSATTRDLLLERFPRFSEKCTVSWNGVSRRNGDMPTRFRRGDGPAQILTVSRLVPRKNIVSAIHAVARCHQRSRLEYDIAGVGSEEAALRQEIELWNLDRIVHLHGFADEITLNALYESGDIFLHPQIALEGGDDFEGFGLSIADAMACGLVCIVGKDGGPSEFVHHGTTGFVVDGGSTGAIIETLDLLVGDPVLCAIIGDRAREWVRENLSWETHCLRCLVEVPASLPAGKIALASATVGTRQGA